MAGAACWQAWGDGGGGDDRGGETGAGGGAVDRGDSRGGSGGARSAVPLGGGGEVVAAIGGGGCGLLAPAGEVGGTERGRGGWGDYSKHAPARTHTRRSICSNRTAWVVMQRRERGGGSIRTAHRTARGINKLTCERKARSACEQGEQDWING